MQKKKFHLLDFESTTATDAADNKAVVTTDSAAANATIIDRLSILAGVAAAVDPRSVNADGVVCTASAHRTAKSWYVKPPVNNILHAGNNKAQAAVLCAVANHTSLFAERKLARINLTKE
jgi:hypothetical protein